MISGSLSTFIRANNIESLGTPSYAHVFIGVPTNQNAINFSTKYCKKHKESCANISDCYSHRCIYKRSGLACQKKEVNIVSIVKVCAHYSIRVLWHKCTTFRGHRLLIAFEDITSYDFLSRNESCFLVSFKLNLPFLLIIAIDDSDDIMPLFSKKA